MQMDAQPGLLTPACFLSNLVEPNWALTLNGVLHPPLLFKYLDGMQINKHPDIQLSLDAPIAPEVRIPLYVSSLSF